jgi:hypothetical protein
MSDSRRIVFGSTRTGPSNLYVQSWDGTGMATRLTTSENPQFPLAVGSSNESVLFLEQRTATGNDIGIVQLRKDGAGAAGEPRMLLEGPFNENTVTITPDNRLIAYSSNESRTNEVYARTFPELGNRIKVSTANGTRPLFSRDGRELFYGEPSGAIMAVPVDANGTFGMPKKLFDWGSSDIVIIVNWIEELKRRLPAD